MVTYTICYVRMKMNLTQLLQIVYKLLSSQLFKLGLVSFYYGYLTSARLSSLYAHLDSLIFGENSLI